MRARAVAAWTAVALSLVLLGGLLAHDGSSPRPGEPWAAFPCDPTGATWVAPPLPVVGDFAGDNRTLLERWASRLGTTVQPPADTSGVFAVLTDGPVHSVQTYVMQPENELERMSGHRSWAFAVNVTAMGRDRMTEGDLSGLVRSLFPSTTGLVSNVRYDSTPSGIYEDGIVESDGQVVAVWARGPRGLGFLHISEWTVPAPPPAMLPSEAEDLGDAALRCELETLGAARPTDWTAATETASWGGHQRLKVGFVPTAEPAEPCWTPSWATTPVAFVWLDSQSGAYLGYFLTREGDCLTRLRDSV